MEDTEETGGQSEELVASSGAGAPPADGSTTRESTPRESTARESTTRESTARKRRRRDWSQLDNPYLILGTLFFVTAALGLPVLWISRKFSPLMKVVWTVVVLLYTALILYLFFLVMHWSLTQIYEAMR